MTLQEWGKPEPGMYYLRHAGHDLEVRRLPLSRRGQIEKRYQVLVDGTFTDLAWNLSQGKTKAIKTAEATHQGISITTFHDRRSINSRPSRPKLTLKKPPETPPPEPAAEPVVEPVVEPVGDTALAAALDAVLDPTSEPIEARSDRPAETGINGCTSLALIDVAQPSQQSGGSGDSVSFTISGSLNMSVADAIATIKAAADLLREHGAIDASAVVPRIIRL